MAIVISGVNNNDKITASDGLIDLLSGVNLEGTVTAPAFSATGNLTAGHINVGDSIQFGNAGIITATTLIGNVTGNVNHTSDLLLQISGSEKLRIANSGAFGLNGTNYGTSGQVLTSQGSGSSPTWSTISVGGDTGIDFNDNVKIRFGTGNDLEIYHDGSSTAILNNNNHQLTIASDNALNLTSRTGTEYYFRAYPNSRAELYYDFSTHNTPKLQTSATGVTVDGTVTATSFSGDGSALTGTGVGSNTSINTTGIVTATAFVGDFQPRNMIINGAMQINARQQGTLTINSSSSQYPCDRWVCRGEGGSKAYTIEKTSIASSGRGVRNALKVVSSQAASVSSHDIFNVRQNIEGFNIQRLNLGEAGCASMTLSFTCYSSVAGTHSGAIQNSAQNRSYPFTYTLAQNTWTDVKITIPPITSGSFNEDTGVGLRVVFDMGSGSAFRGTANQWNSAQNEGATGAVRILETNGATWWVSKVQLEEGTVATPFEKRLVADEIKECERYYQRYGAQRHMWMTNVNGSDHRKMVYFPTTMRATPSMNLYDQSVDGSSVSAQGVTPNGYYCKLNGNGRHAAWKHEANAEI